MRPGGIAAVGETINILTDDDARYQFHDGGTFMQLRKAYLAAAGDKLNSKRLTYLAVSVQNDVFAKV